MKKAAIILMGICLCLSIPVAAEAAQPYGAALGPVNTVALLPLSASENKIVIVLTAL